MNTKIGDYNLTFEEVLLETIRIESHSFQAELQPDIEGVRTWILRDSVRSKKIAKYWTIRDRHTGNVHHHQLTIETINHVKKDKGWFVQEKNTITLSDEDENDISKLFNALASIPQIGDQGDAIIINPRDHNNDRLHQILNALAKSGRKVDLLAEILSWSDNDPNVTAGLIKLASDHPLRSKSLAAGLNYGRYSKSLHEFKDLVEADRPEREYQSFLEHNSWMFGSEYAELMPKRALALGIQLDFPLRRTVDGYLEIIEIKTPLNDKPLFLKDNSHDNLYPRTELGQDIAQARKYLRILDADQYRILAQDKILVEKVRAKVIVGRDRGNSELLEAIRQLNADQNRVEVITYDGLIRIAERILEILGNEASIMELNK